MSTNSIQNPRATYRVQLTADFGFAAAAGIADYLSELGISHLYASPYLQAAPGSRHGYDVVDHRKVNRELGGREGHEGLCRALRDNGLGQILDIVPNHMAIVGRENALWQDVLENGPAARYASFFDIDWGGTEPGLQGRVLMPILGSHYGRVLEAGELIVRRNGCGFFVHYFNHILPLDTASLGTILATAADAAGSEELGFIADGLATLTSEPARRGRDKKILCEWMDRLFREDPSVAQAVDTMIAEINRNHDILDSLLNVQHYRLAFWRTSNTILNYRRFFNVNTLVGIRMEAAEVFEEAHRMVLAWVYQGLIDGLRIDHPDGLWDPEQYLRRLRVRATNQWIIVEKILAPGESLPASWPVQGTTGYDFLNRVNGIFIDPAGEKPLTEFYREFTGESTDYAGVVREKKHLVLQMFFGGEVNRLVSSLARITQRHRCYRDYCRRELRDALIEVLVSFPVYRTYVESSTGEISDADLQYIDAAVARAKAVRPDICPLLIDFIRDLLILAVRGDLEAEFVMRVQQFTGPLAAKGVEDTAFYCYNRFVALNEVGGDPGIFGTCAEEFHRLTAETQSQWPTTMLSTSTHDTKRSEDVRARLNVLSEIPDQWIAAVRRWAAHNERYRQGGLPDRNTEYFLYQNMLGAWPIPLDRLLGYMDKAVREAKVHTTWTDPNPEYEGAVKSFVTAIMADSEFLRDFEAFLAPLIEPGRINSLAQTLIKYTAPGVPDLYQGTELWDLSLVDPDNRRPVDFERCRRRLNEIKGLSVPDIMKRMDEGLPKLFLIRTALAVRQENPDLFVPESSYQPLWAQGANADHILAFVRSERLVSVVPRWLMRLGSDWGDTAITLPEGRWTNVLTEEQVAGGSVPVAALFAKFPVALLLC